MIDTHAHLTKRLNESLMLPKVKTILSASCMEDSAENVELANLYPDVLWAAVGVHPQEKVLDIKKLEELAMDKKVVAIGECGMELLDRRDEIVEKQEKIFIEQIKLAIKVGKPLIVHSRKASDETVEILKNYQNLRGVIHCYSGGKKRIKKFLAISDNWYFGIDGNLTYEIGLEEVVKEIPKDRLLLETDSPLLTPVPFRGEINKPDYVEYVYKKVAEIWGMSFEETEKIIDGNATRLFSLS